MDVGNQVPERSEVSKTKELVSKKRLRLGGRKENLPGNTNTTRVVLLGPIREVEF